MIQIIGSALSSGNLAAFLTLTTFLLLDHVISQTNLVELIDMRRWCLKLQGPMLF